MPAGRPLLWTEPQVLADAIDSYFASISRLVPKQEPVLTGYDDKGKPLYEDKPVLTSSGSQYMATEWLEPPTLSALADYLGCDRQTLLNYRNKDEYFGTLRAAKAKIERYLASGLVTTANPKGYEFSLKNNHNWKDAQTLDISHSQALPSYDVSRMTLEQKRALIELIDLATDSGQDAIDVPYKALE